MTERDKHVYALLSRSRVYNTVQRIFSLGKTLPQFVNDFLRPQEGQRLLDIGCGTAKILHYLPKVDYIGFDPNPAYIKWAQNAFGNRGTFYTGRFTAASAAAVGQVDIAMLIAVLHHLSDDEALELFDLLRNVVKPGGRVVTLDNVFVDKQNPIARLLITLDRGGNVRTPDEYTRLARASFQEVRGAVVHRTIPPYTYWIMEAA
jgi:SAM-dependent methyltransferase